jgi:uncharacterized protein (DUF302 family)
MSADVTTTAAGIGKFVACGYDEAISRAEAALKAEGFGVLTRIDVKATLKEKLGVDMAPYVILGACNPSFAHKALEAEPQVGLLMPCNLVVRDDRGRIRVEAMNAALMAQMFPGKPLAPLADEITSRLRRVIEAI